MSSEYTVPSPRGVGVPRIPTAAVPKDVLDRLFDEFDIWAKIGDGRLVTKALDGTPSSTWPEATSYIVKHLLTDGKHVVTTHCVKDDKGNLYHWDVKDMMLGGIRLWRD